MITRFRLETEGVSHIDCRRQLEAAITALMVLDRSPREDWEITDDVSWRENGIYLARVVLKRRGG